MTLLYFSKRVHLTSRKIYLHAKIWHSTTSGCRSAYLSSISRAFFSGPGTQILELHLDINPILKPGCKILHPENFYQFSIREFNCGKYSAIQNIVRDTFVNVKISKRFGKYLVAICLLLPYHFPAFYVHCKQRFFRTDLTWASDKISKNFFRFRNGRLPKFEIQICFFFKFGLALWLTRCLLQESQLQSFLPFFKPLLK